jgi:hypothetical protein
MKASCILAGASIGAIALLGVPLAGAASGSAPVTQTLSVTVDSTATPYAPISLPAVNKNFSEVVTVSANATETTTWCPFGCETTYTNGDLSTNAPVQDTNAPNSAPGQAQVGAVQYSVGRGQWYEIDHSTTITGNGPVELRYVDGYTLDNSGAYTVTVQRTTSVQS